jgi:hypothetical protein
MEEDKYALRCPEIKDREVLEESAPHPSGCLKGGIAIELEPQFTFSAAAHLQG